MLSRTMRSRKRSRACLAPGAVRRTRAKNREAFSPISDAYVYTLVSRVHACVSASASDRYARTEAYGRARH